MMAVALLPPVPRQTGRVINTEFVSRRSERRSQVGRTVILTQAFGRVRDVEAFKHRVMQGDFLFQ